MAHWSPREEQQFTAACKRCRKRIKRYYNGNWQGYDGLFVCFLGPLPVPDDLERRHEPA